MRRQTAPPWGYFLALVLVGFCLGLLLQVQVHTPPGSAEAPQYEQAQIQATIQRLEAEQLELKETIGRLRALLEYYQQVAASETETLGELRDELDIQRMRAGLVALEGPGVVVSLNDSEAVPLSSNEDLSPSIVHEYDLRDVVNLLWTAGAEAVAINDERIATSTSIYCVGSMIMVNDTRLSPPYIIRAIGDPATLYAVATAPAYLRDLRYRVQRYGLKLAVDWHSKIVLPAYKGSFAFEYARAGGS